MIRTVLLTALALIALASNAEARQRHKTYVADPGCNVTMPCEGVTPSARGEYIAKSGFGSAQKVYTPRVSAKRVDRQIVDRAPKGIGQSYTLAAAASQVVGGRPAGCPRAFCGCGASLHLFGKIIPSLNLAANWLRFPRAAPAPQMAAARSGHVMVLEQHIAGNVWLVHDSNSGGHLTRLHARSIAGYTVVNPHASRYASAL